jgi:alkane 1-monooxygenase
MSTLPLPDPSVPYVDRKRHAWVLSLAVPMLVGLGPVLYRAWPQAVMLWFPVIFVYCVAPLIDLALGADASNPPEDAVPRLEADRYYRRVTFALVPLLWGAFVYGAWFCLRTPLTWSGQLAVVMTTGMVGGFCINLGHELGHKKTRLERWLAKIVLAPTFYGHFTIEHNRGHHRDVATAADPASARMGEGIWRFVLREMPGAFRRAWQLERERMRAARPPEGERAAVRRTKGRPAPVDGQPFWSLHNELLQPALITAALWTSLALWLGPKVLVFLLLASLWANFQLTTANYIEHYGLLRRAGADGRPERTAPQHSWNSNHLFSNWAVFHLQRHSDHHAHPLRRYQSLRHFDDVPQLPIGYFGMFTIAYFPPLWFALMDGRLVRAVHSDASRINFHPRRRAALMRRHGLADVPAA